MEYDILFILNLLPISVMEFDEKIKKLSPEKMQAIVEKLQYLINSGYVTIYEQNGIIEYRLTQSGEELREEIKKKLLSEIKLAEEFEIHPAGGVIPQIKLWYEPINEKEFVYNWNGTKGIAVIKEAKGGLHYLEIEGKRFWFNSPPLNEKELSVFNKLNPTIIYDWVNGKRKPLSTNEMWEKVYNYFKTFFDFSEEINYTMVTLTVFLSYLKHLLPATWYLLIYGEFGGGKTTLGELISLLSYHGCKIANMSISFIGRGLDRLRITPFIDEFDAVNDEELLALVRQGYRRGQKYARINKEGMKPEIFDIYTNWIISIHGMAEEALTTRAFPILVSETQDRILPIINLAKENYANTLYNELMIWWGENSVKIMEKLGNPLGEVENNSQLSKDEIFKSCTKYLTKEDVEKLTKATGRSMELGYLMLLSSRIIGIELDIQKVFETMESMMDEIRETGIIGSLRDYLVKLYKELKYNPNFRNSANEFMIANKDVYQRFNDYLVSTRQEKLSPKKFKALLLDLGFSGDARKHAKIPLLSQPDEEPSTRLALIFTPKVCKRLGINYSEMVSVQTRKSEEKKEEKQNLLFL